MKLNELLELHGHETLTFSSLYKNTISYSNDNFHFSGTTEYRSEFIITETLESLARECDDFHVTDRNIGKVVFES